MQNRFRSRIKNDRRTTKRVQHQWLYPFFSELVFIGNICGFSSKFFCRQGKNLQAYFRMARIFNAVCNKICRKDVDRRL